MIKKSTKNDLKSSAATISGSTELAHTSDDFRATLIKSGIDVSDFQAVEQENFRVSKNSSTVYSTNFAKDETKSAKNQQAKSILESPETAKKHLPKLGRWQHLTVIGGITAIIVLQSVFQFSFIQGENQRLAEDLTENASPVGQKIEKNIIPEVPAVERIEVKPPKTQEKIAYKNATAKNLIQSKKSASKVQKDIPEVSAKTAFRKKEQRESTAERIRRAEKILTGV